MKNCKNKCNIQILYNKYCMLKVRLMGYHEINIKLTTEFNFLCI